MLPRLAANGAILGPSPVGHSRSHVPCSLAKNGTRSIHEFYPFIASSLPLARPSIPPDLPYPPFPRQHPHPPQPAGAAGPRAAALDGPSVGPDEARCGPIRGSKIGSNMGPICRSVNLNVRYTWHIKCQRQMSNTHVRFGHRLRHA
jgi:hypothetical protein